MHRELVFISLAIAAASASADIVQAPAAAPFDEVYITNIRADPTHCNIGRARRVAFDTVVRDYRSLDGHCVAVRGTWWQFALYRRLADARASARDASDFSGHRIGLYGPREIMDQNYARARVEVTAVGNVGKCEHWVEAGVSIMGYCHSVNAGPYIALAEMYFEP
jgi:hypothetical protein